MRLVHGICMFFMAVLAGKVGIFSAGLIVAKFMKYVNSQAARRLGDLRPINSQIAYFTKVLS